MIKDNACKFMIIIVSEFISISDTELIPISMFKFFRYTLAIDCDNSITKETCRTFEHAMFPHIL